MNYEVGDIVSYRTFSGELRRVKVDEKDADIKNGRPGFGGAIVGAAEGPYGPEGVWGYDSQIVKVEKGATDGA